MTGLLTEDNYFINYSWASGGNGQYEDEVMAHRKSTDTEERVMCEICHPGESPLEQVFFPRALWEGHSTENGLEDLKAWGTVCVCVCVGMGGALLCDLRWKVALALHRYCLKESCVLWGDCVFFHEENPLANRSDSQLKPIHLQLSVD